MIDEVEEGLKLIGELVEYAQKFTRKKCDVSKLVVGLKCGGSDGFSGLTANPLVGQFSDLLISHGRKHHTYRSSGDVWR